MADAVATRILFKGNKRAEYIFSNLSDGTGEAAVQKVDISALPGAPTKVAIEKVQFVTVGMAVNVLFDHTADDLALVLNGTGEFCMKDAPLADPASAGGTGDILFTTVGHTNGDSYCIKLCLRY